MYGGGGMAQHPPPPLWGQGAAQSLLGRACRMHGAPTPARPVGEVDGISHIDSLTDGIRDTWIQQLDVHVFRVTNHDLLSNVEGVRLAIQQAAVALPPNMLPQGEGES